MKKIKSICIFTVLLIMVFSNTFFVMADDTGYYIKNYNVDVVVNDKRQCIVTETIDVYFNEKRHGIKRDIPIVSSIEDFAFSEIFFYKVSPGNTKTFMWCIIQIYGKLLGVIY
ncbi:Hypothetical protein CM240_2704 [Clostridium bornimense]|uniref:Secreted protein n=1 Tax=Clostridium bornimense TaxID=1216932 RepID=W6RYU4_9CLOT|nr:DUF2207 domain-containing protein [Clostridium bornimense]CDM69821.1 Hypothetical protein CM240_2704 [Clostridium bornimense]